MISLIWISVFCLLVELGGGDLNPYTEALRSRPWYSKKGYVEVRPGAHMFYWLYYADGRYKKADEKPLVIWIQGGPGIAASGVGNFLELGPLDRNMQPRNHTWVHGRNVLLIDHPVGTGFSYVANSSLLAKTDHEVAMDLERLIKVFYKRHKKFHTTPAYLFSQSYGGKICPRVAFYLYKAIQRKTLKMNLKGIGIGSGWVDPKESTLMQPQYLYHMGIIDQHTYLKSNVIARQISECIDNRDYKKASKLEIPLFRVITAEAGMLINFNNINQHIMYEEMSLLDATVNLYVKPTMPIVNQSMKWSYISEDVFDSLKMNFFLPSTSYVEILLNKTDLKVAIYNGNLDVVTPLAGATNWVHKLRWPGSQEFKLAPRIQIEGIMKGFRKIYGNLSFWWVFGSGHWVPEDNPDAMSQILDYVTKQ